MDSHAIPIRGHILSARAMLSSCLKISPNSEVSSLTEFRTLLRVLCFKFGHLHSNYYLIISKRHDVISHRALLIPFLRLAMTDDRFFYVNTDWSFIYENAHRDSGWISLVKADSDLIDCKPGKGRRLNVCEFITRHGVLTHPDGTSAGTVCGPNQILDANSIVKCVQRGVEAILAHPEVVAGKKIPVLHIDGARTNMTLPADAINPKKMNLSDGGKNRQAMHVIGMKGLRTVLQENGRWRDGMDKSEAMDEVFQWRVVRDQLNRVEELCFSHGVIVIFNSKSHPWLAMIEKLWRYVKNKVEDLMDLALIRNEYNATISAMQYGTPLAEAKCTKWWNRVCVYSEYYARGGTDIIRDSLVDSLDLSKFPHPAPKYRFLNIDTLRSDAHKMNWIVRQGKHYKSAQNEW